MTRLKYSYEFNLSELKKWENRANLALIKNEEYLLKEALFRKQHFAEHTANLKRQIEQHNSYDFVDNWRKQIFALEIKLAELESLKRNISKLSEATTKLSDDPLETDFNEASSTFRRMEQKLKELEAEELGVLVSYDYGDMERFKYLNLEQRLDKLENIVSTLQAEISAIKTQLKFTSSPRSEEVDSHLTISLNSLTDIDTELEELRRQLDL